MAEKEMAHNGNVIDLENSLRLWLPKFLRRNHKARVLLGVLVPASMAAKPLLTFPTWKGFWEDKMKRVLLNDQGSPEWVKDGLEDVDSRLPLEWRRGEHNMDRNVELLYSMPKVSLALSPLTDYLRDPSPENEKELREAYPDDPEEPYLSPAEERREQLDQDVLSLIEYL